jgi:hypothetical protein
MAVLLLVVGIVIGVILVLGLGALRGYSPRGSDPAVQERLDRYCRKSA